MLIVAYVPLESLTCHGVKPLGPHVIVYAVGGDPWYSPTAKIHMARGVEIQIPHFELCSVGSDPCLMNPICMSPAEDLTDDWIRTVAMAAPLLGTDNEPWMFDRTPVCVSLSRRCPP